MRNLLAAGFVRLWKCQVFWLSCAFVAAATLRSIWTRYYEGLQLGYHSSLDTAFLYYVLFISVLIPVVCTLFIGVEYADGTMRNKLICGHSKSRVYLSNLIVCSVASLIMCTSAVAPGLCMGIPLLGGFEMGWNRAILFFVSVYALSLAWTALFTLVAMLVSSRTISAVEAIILALTLLMAGTYIEGRLEAQPTIQGYALTVGGEVVEAEESPNPAYLPEGPVRNTFQFLNDFSPGGQTLKHINRTAGNQEMMIVYDAVFFLTATAAGLLLFKRKDLK